MGLSHGQAVVSELRVCPNENRRPYGYGHWSADGLGVLAAVPPGGLNARLLRQLSIGSHLAVLRTLPPDDVRQFPARGWLFAKQPPGRRTRPATGQQRGRPRLPDQVYQELVRRYTALVKAGDKAPCRTLAKEKNWSHSRVRSALFRADQRGIV